VKIVLGFFLVVCAIVFGIFFATPTIQGQKDEATVVRRGQITEREREYSKIYEKEYDFRKGEKLSQIRGNEVTIFEPSIPGNPDALSLTAEKLLNDLSCNSDAAVSGSVTAKSSHLTEDESFIYTEYDFSVKEVIKNNAAAPIDSNSNIQITRPGGIIRLDGRVIKLTDRSFEALNVNNQYLLFLKFVPATGGYKAFNPQGDFRLQSGEFSKLTTKGELPEEFKYIKSEASFIQAVSNANLRGCKGGLAKRQPPIKF